MALLGGMVSVEDGRKGAQEFQPPRKVRVEIAFEAITDLDAAGQLASAKVAELLTAMGGSVASKPAVATMTDKDKLAHAAGLTPPSETPAPTHGRGRPRKPPPPAPAATVPDAIADELMGSSAAPAAPTPPVEDNFLDGLDTPPAEITDKDLQERAGRKNAKTFNGTGGPKIRELIAKFSDGDIPSLRLIPQAKRAEFLAALEALT